MCDGKPVECLLGQLVLKRAKREKREKTGKKGKKKL